MCVLCWQFFTEEHWTEHPVGGHPWTGPSRETIAGGEQEHLRRRHWRHRTWILHHILSGYGLHVESWQSRSYLLSDRKGSTLVIQDLGELWLAAEHLAGRPLDPLAPSFLQALTGAGNGPESGR